MRKAPPLPSPTCRLCFVPGIYPNHFKGQQKGNKQGPCAATYLPPLAPGRWEKGVNREHQQAQQTLSSSMLCEQSSSRTSDLQQLSFL